MNLVGKPFTIQIEDSAANFFQSLDLISFWQIEDSAWHRTCARSLSKSFDQDCGWVKLEDLQPSFFYNPSCFLLDCVVYPIDFLEEQSNFSQLHQLQSAASRRPKPSPLASPKKNTSKIRSVSLPSVWSVIFHFSEEPPTIGAAAGIWPGLWHHWVLRCIEGLQWSLRMAAGLGDLEADGWRGKKCWDVGVDLGWVYESMYISIY